jgi:hypothetical protein
MFGALLGLYRGNEDTGNATNVQFVQIKKTNQHRIVPSHPHKLATREINRENVRLHSHETPKNAASIPANLAKEARTDLTTSKNALFTPANAHF